MVGLQLISLVCNKKENNASSDKCKLRVSISTMGMEPMVISRQAMENGEKWDINQSWHFPPEIKIEDVKIGLNDFGDLVVRDTLEKPSVILFTPFYKYYTLTYEVIK
jgi:hypothetical protein